MISDNFVHQPSSGEAHFVLRSLEQYEHALVNAGFKILDRRPMFHLLNRPMDSRSPLLWRWWSLVEFVCRKSHALGGLLAASAFPFELAFVRVRREGASTELMVCERL